MSIKLNYQKEYVTYSMLSTDIKPTSANDGDTLEVLDDVTKTVIEIWRWHENAWYKY